MGCDFFFKKKEDNDQPSNTTLVSFRKLTTFSITASTMDQLLNSDSHFNDKILQNATQFAVNVYNVVYKTTYKGQEREASGACVIPRSDNPLPILSYQHGTIFHNNDAPSQFTDIFNINVEMGMNLILASCGFICSSPDYLGYGESLDLMHPYHHASSIATASLDMLKAVNELCRELDINTQNSYYLAGYSEGGYATLALQKEIETKHANEFPIMAVSAGAGAYDLLSTAREFLNKPTLRNPPFTCFLFVAYNEVYDWGRGMEEIFQSPYWQRIENGIFNGYHTYNQINSKLTSNVNQLFTPSFLSAFRGSGEQQLKSTLDQNNLYKGWTPQAPTRLYHGSADQTVPPSNSITAENRFIQNGAQNVSYIPMGGKNHTTGTFSLAKNTIKWFQNFL